MIKVLARGTDSVWQELLWISSLKISKEEDMPADIAILSVWSAEFMIELTAIKILLGEKVIFEGIVDEQISHKMGNQVETRLVARSRIAILIDNQARPQLYKNVNFEKIFERHIKCYGFSNLVMNGVKDPNVCLENFAVRRGFSELRVASDFCRMAFGKSIKVTQDGAFEVGRKTGARHLKLCNNAQDLLFADASVIYKRHNIVSQVFVKDGCDYKLCVPSLEALAREISVKRYIEMEAGLTQDKSEMAKEYLKSRNKEGLILKVVIPELIEVELKDKVSFYEDGLKLENMLICGIQFEQDRNGWRTRLTARRES